jgi:hypothetical protein
MLTYFRLRQPVEGGAQDEVEIMGSRPLFGFLGLCNGIGMSTHGFTHAYAYFVMYK